MIGARVLIISDEQETAIIISQGLERRGIEVDMTSLDSSVVQLCAQCTFDLAIVDVNDRFSDTLSLCQQIRTVFDGPALVLTYEADERLHLQLYSAGINEVVAKPIGVPLFLAKVSSWLHRVLIPSSRFPSVQHVDFQLDTVNRILTRPDGIEVKLSNLEYRLVFPLLMNRGQLVETDLLIDRMWHEYGDGDSIMLKNVVYRLRRKIETNPNESLYLETVAGHGYRFRSD